MKIGNLMHSEFGKILGTFAKLRIASITFVMSVCPSLRPSDSVEQLGSQWADFHKF